MYKLNYYLFTITTRYIFVNLLILTSFVMFLHLIDIARILEKDNQNLYHYFLLSLLKIPTVINEVMPFVIVISISFLFRYLINNNELISMRNIGFSIFDIFKPISFSVFMFGIFVLIFLNPLSTKFEKKYESLINKKISDVYSIKFVESGMWIKNNISETNLYFINIKEIDLKEMLAEKIKILIQNDDEKKLIISTNGIINNKNFILQNVTIFDINLEEYYNKEEYILPLNFTKDNIVESIVNYRQVPYYSYYNHIKTLKKFNLYSPEISLFYLSEILKPFFIVMLAFVVVGFSGKYKRNENFFKILFIAILIGFLIFFLKEIITKFTISQNFNFIFSYLIIFFGPFLIGLYQNIKIEND